MDAARLASLLKASEVMLRRWRRVFRKQVGQMYFKKGGKGQRVWANLGLEGPRSGGIPGRKTKRAERREREALLRKKRWPCSGSRGIDALNCVAVRWKVSDGEHHAHLPPPHPLHLLSQWFPHLNLQKRSLSCSNMSRIRRLPPFARCHSCSFLKLGSLLSAMTPRVLVLTGLGGWLLLLELRPPGGLVWSEWQDGSFGQRWGDPGGQHRSANDEDAGGRGGETRQSQ